jgi:hypothetical protein
MNRQFGWAMLVAVGMVFGCALSSYEKTSAAPPKQDVEEQDPDIARQLKDIRTYVKEINTVLHSGSVRVVVLLNPDSDRR